MRPLSALRFFPFLVAIAVSFPFARSTEAFGADVDTFVVVNFGSTAYRIDGVNNATLALTRGLSYRFQVSATGHPFYIKTQRITSTGSQYTSGVTGQGVQNGALTFAVPMDAPDNLFYQCSIHFGMGGTLQIVDPLAAPPLVPPTTLWLGLATPNPARDGTWFRFGLARHARFDFDVFDPHGRLMWHVSYTIPAGDHVLRWDGRDPEGGAAPSGIYLYRLSTEGRKFARRFALIR